MLVIQQRYNFYKVNVKFKDNFLREIYNKKNTTIFLSTFHDKKIIYIEAALGYLIL